MVLFLIHQKKYTSNNFAISFHIFSEDYFMESHFAQTFFENAIKDVPHEFPYEEDIIAYHEEKPILPILNDWQCGRNIYPILLEYIKDKDIPKGDKKFLRSIFKVLFDPEVAADSKITITIGIQIIHNLKDAGYNLYVLSNWDAIISCDERIHAEVFDLFDGIMISGDEGIVKPNVQFFKKCLKTFNLKAKESLFIDDQHINVVGAQKQASMHLFLMLQEKEIIRSFQEYNIVEREVTIEETL